MLVAAAVGGWGLSRRRASARLAAGAPAVTVLAVRHGNRLDLRPTGSRAPFAVLDVRVPEPAGGPAGDEEGYWDDDEWADAFAWSTEEQDLSARSRPGSARTGDPGRPRPASRLPRRYG